MANYFDGKSVTAQARPAFSTPSERQKMFPARKRFFRNTIYLAALLAASATSYAQSSCTDIGAGGPIPPVMTPDSTFAVAANFATAAQTLAQDYISTSATTLTAIRVCSGSSGALYTDITSASPSQAYTLFLSADQKRPTLIQGTALGIGNAFQYANGIPVFYTAAGTAASYLNQGLPSSESTAVADGLNNFVNVRKGTGAVVKLGIGNPTLAPYGAQAQSILTLMNQWPTDIYDAGSETTPGADGSCTKSSSSTQDTCEYDDIGFTKDAITYGDVTAGFISWGQVCNASSSSYVKFSAYPIQQYGILLNLPSASTGAKNIASDFLAYMNIGGADPHGMDWNDWLTSNCYGTI